MNYRILSIISLVGFAINCKTSQECNNCTDTSSSSSTGRDTDIQTATYFDISSSSSSSTSSSSTSFTSSSTEINSSSETSSGILEFCGDLIINLGEECDNGNENKSYDQAKTGECVSPDCKIATCGDSLRNLDEECDSEKNCNNCIKCGNGIVGGDEECDDGNENTLDGCNNCKIEHVAFVTSDVFSGKLGGVSGANKICQNLADKSLKFGDLKFKAWIEDDNYSPFTTFSVNLRNFKGIIRKVNEDILANSGWEDLKNNTLTSRLNYDEYGNLVKNIVHVWSNVGAPVDQQHSCKTGQFSWTNEDPNMFGNIGITEAINKNWTFYDMEFEEIKCDKQHRLYCFSQ